MCDGSTGIWHESIKSVQVDKSMSENDDEGESQSDSKSIAPDSS